jgi:hypothetical protein
LSQVATLANGWTAWISESAPAGISNDLGLLKRNLDSFNACFEEAEAAVADGIYTSLQGINPETQRKWTTCEFISKHVATRGRTLSPEQIAENNLIEDDQHTN